MKLSEVSTGAHTLKFADYIQHLKDLKLDPDEDIDAIAEGLGSDAIRFAEYIALTRATDKAKKDMRRLALALLKQDFIFPTTYNVRLNKDEDDMAGFGFSFIFPDEKDVHQRAGILTVMYTTFKENSKGEQAMHRWTGHYSATEILEMGLDKFMEHARRNAKPVR